MGPRAFHPHGDDRFGKLSSPVVMERISGAIADRPSFTRARTKPTKTPDRTPRALRALRGPLGTRPRTRQGFAWAFFLEGPTRAQAWTPDAALAPTVGSDSLISMKRGRSACGTYFT